MKLQFLVIVLLLLITQVGVWPVFGTMPSHSQTSAAKTKEAKKLFKQKCAKCHGTDGAGTQYGQILGATDLTDPEWQKRADDESILNSITHGRGLMPGFNKKLTKEQLALLAAYVNSFK